MGHTLRRLVPFVPFVPLACWAGLVLLPAHGSGHLSMAYMPGLGTGRIGEPPIALLTLGLVAALGIARLLGRRRDLLGGIAAPLGLAAAPLAHTVVHLATLGDLARSSAPGAERVAPSVAELGGHIGSIAMLGAAHFWALLSVAALLSGTALALVLRGLTERTPAARELHVGSAVLATAVGGALVLVIVGTSTGVDLLSSWIRWGACGVAVTALVLGALAGARASARPGAALARDTVCLVFLLTVGLALVAEREYVEALGADVLARSNPWRDPRAYLAGLREIAAAAEPREWLAPLVGVLPWLFLASPGLRARATNAIPALAAGVLLTVVAFGTSRGLDLAARSVAGGEAFEAMEASPVEGRGDEVVAWSERVLPRTVPWILARRVELDATPAWELCSSAPTPRATDAADPWASPITP